MMISEGKPLLSKHCRMMTICGIRMIGNIATGAFIGLDQEGEKFIQNLHDNKEINPDTLTKNTMMLMQALHDSGCFNHDDPEMRICNAYLHVTSHCNLQCPGCYSIEADRNTKIDMTLEQVKLVIKKIASIGVQKLVVSGGEPFLRNDLLHIVRYAKEEAGMIGVTCITNGLAPIESYREVGNYLDRLAFSLDSHNAATASIRPPHVFETVLNKIRELKKVGVPVAIIFTLHKINYDKIDAMESFAHNLGVPFNFSALSVANIDEHTAHLVLDDTQFNHMYDKIKSGEGGVLSDIEALGNALSCKLLCSAGRNMVSISSDGSLYPCHMFNGYRDFYIGNALTDDIAMLLRNNSNIFWHMTVDDVEVCAECNVKYLCGGGCRFRGYATTNSVNSCDVMCSIAYANVERGIMRLIKSEIT